MYNIARASRPMASAVRAAYVSATVKNSSGAQTASDASLHCD